MAALTATVKLFLAVQEEVRGAAVLEDTFQHREEMAIAAAPANEHTTKRPTDALQFG
jgi:hypothetical protein